MVLELGLKLTRDADEFSSTNLQITKDRSGHVFVSKETDKLFILTAHLQGYTKSSINIEINEDGSCITISGEKTVEETVIIGWQVEKIGVNIKRFRKSFKIPDGVILDKINAKFSEDESMLTINMPKKVKGFLGRIIEEVKEEMNIDEGTSKGELSQKRKDKEVEAIEEIDEGDEKSPKARKIEKANESEEQVIYDHKEHEMKGENDHIEQSKEIQETSHENVEQSKDIQETSQSKDDCVDSSCSKQKEDQDEQNGDHVNDKEVKEREVQKRGEGEEMPKRSILCAPIIAGSAILLSLVVFVFQLMKTKNQSGKRKD